jgi:hypothetical protein
MLSDLMLDLGRLDESEAWAAESLEAAQAVGDALVLGYSLERAAYVHALRGDADRAESVLEEARPVIDENPEPWLQGWAPLIAGHIAQARGSDEEAARALTAGARPLLDRILVWGGKNLLLECVRSLVRVGHAEDARPFRDRLALLAVASVPARAMLTWADGLLESDPATARALLGDASAQFEALGNQIELGRCLIDLAEVERRAGAESSASSERARRVLEACGARLFLAELRPVSSDGRRAGA